MPELQIQESVVHTALLNSNMKLYFVLIGLASIMILVQKRMLMTSITTITARALEGVRKSRFAHKSRRPLQFHIDLSTRL
ncbi:hypothetical protein BDR05DRAFT_959530 [Suillus weaverae]|nr:hypothetical protein BDR05DRAFT_959530 [Suillus weaverae]